MIEVLILLEYIFHRKWLNSLKRNELIRNDTVEFLDAKKHLVKKYDGILLYDNNLTRKEFIVAKDKILKYKSKEIHRLYINKSKRKGRTEDEVLQVIRWLSGYSKKDILSINDSISLEDFFMNAPLINPNAGLINGTVCEIKVQEIEDPIIQQIRYMDKLIDELAKGKKTENIFRK